jgi:hypothetical protein
MVRWTAHRAFRAQAIRAGVNDLRLNFGAVLVHGIDQSPVSGDRLVGADLQTARSDGSPSGVPYIVSIGDITSRLRTVTAPIRPGCSSRTKPVTGLMPSSGRAAGAHRRGGVGQGSRALSTSWRSL